MLAALIGIALVVWTLTRPKPLPHPLAIAPAEIVAVTIDGAPAPAAALLLPRKLAVSRAVPAPAWVEPRTLRFALRSGVVLWVQAMPEGRDALLRVTADIPAKPARSQLAQAARLRALRLHAYRLPAESLEGIFEPTDLSTGTKRDHPK